MELPSNGDFEFRATGYDATTVGNAQWELCGKSGRLGHQMNFQMRNGVCRPSPVTNERSDVCTFELSVLHDLSSQPELEAVSTQGVVTSSGVPFLPIIATAVVGVVFLTAVVVVGMTMRSRQNHAGGFQVLDSTEHVQSAQLPRQVLDEEMKLTSLELETLPAASAKRRMVML